MADSTISNLPANTAVDPVNDVLPIVNNGVTKKASPQGIVNSAFPQVPFTPTGGISSTTVNAAIAELDTEKANTSTVNAALALKADTTALPTAMDSATAQAGTSTTAQTVSASVLDGAVQYGAFTPAGTGAVSRTVQSKLRDVVSVKDFGAVGDGVTDDTAAIQAAINYARTVNFRVYLSGGTYKVSTQLTLSDQDCLIGTGKYATVLNYLGASSAILCSNWSGEISGLTISIANLASSAIEVGTSSRNCLIENVYLDATAVGATTTGAGIYLNAGTGWSGGLTIRDSYSLQFKYGVKMVGTHISTGTWTSVCMYNLWVVGNSGGIVVGSCGISMDALTDGIGTIMQGGTIEAFATGILVANGGHGGVFETDMEGNIINYQVGASFAGRISPSLGFPFLNKTANAGSSTFPWQALYIPDGTNPINEYYYPIKTNFATGSSDIVETSWNRVGTSIINGGSYDVHSLKFAIGLGQGGTYGIDVHPSNHYIKIDDRKISFGATIPSSRSGSQLVAWTVGSVCFNSDTSSMSLGWICTIAGTPGTWVSIGRRVGVNTIGDVDVTLDVNGYYPTSIFSTALTATRAVTLSTTGAALGDKLRISRPSSGAFNLNIGTGPLKALPASSWCDVEYNGTSWFLSAYGTL